MICVNHTHIRRSQAGHTEVTARIHRESRRPFVQRPRSPAPHRPWARQL